MKLEAQPKNPFWSDVLVDRVNGSSMVFANAINPRSEIRRMDQLKPTLVKKGTTLGANCTILCGVTIGRYTLVGAGAVVTKDVPDFALVIGAPASIQGWMCECGIKLAWIGDKAVCPCEKQYGKTSLGILKIQSSNETEGAQI